MREGNICVGVCRPGSEIQQKRREMDSGYVMTSTPDNSIQLEGIHCRMLLNSPANGVILLRIEGRDVGELGARPLEAIEQFMPETSSVSLFVDAWKTTGASIEVSNEWAQWLRRHRDRFSKIHFLTQSSFVRITAEFVRRFSNLGDLMSVYSDERAFRVALDSSRKTG